jgi:zinc protease
VVHALLCTLMLSASPAKAPLVSFEKYTLPNGLRVILSEDHKTPVVAVMVWYHVGAANEVPGKSGFAHLFEHMMFQGSKHRPGNETAFFGMLQGAGATGVNGTTNFDRTNYFEVLPTNQLELGLWLESERLGFLLDAMDQQKLDIQRDVVRNERRQSTENRPYGRADVRLVELLFPKPHPYFGSVIGSHEDLQAASLDDVKAFFRTYYAPNNAVLTIVGDIKPAEVKPLVEKYFGSIPAVAAVPVPKVKTEPLTSPKRETMTDSVQLSKVMVGVVVPPAYSTDDFYAVQLLCDVLSAGKSSRLYRELVYTQKVAQGVNADIETARLASYAEVDVTVAPGVPPEKAEAALDIQLKQLMDAPPSAAELDRVKRNRVANVLRRLERVGGFGGKADVLESGEFWMGDPGFIDTMVAKWDAVTPAQVQAAAQKYFAKDARVVITVNPAPKAASNP